ncbi:MAG: hypothetical protein ABIX01_03020 [Chitinophagaceae bacterium]
MNKYISLFILLSLTLIFQTGFGQASSFHLAINTNVFRAGDTLQLQADYAVGNKKLPPATLDIIIENEAGNTWNIRWPMLDGSAAGSIIISRFIPKGRYHVWVAVQPRTFRIYGQVVYYNRKKLKELQALIVASNTQLESQKILLEPDRSFVIKDWQVTNEMTVSFETSNPEDILHIHPECWLDSAYRPAAQSYVSVLVTDADTVLTTKSKAPAIRPMAWNGTGAYSNMLPADIYNRFFSYGMFRDTSEKLIDVMGDSTVGAETNTMEYISAKLLEAGVATEVKGNKLLYNDKELVLFINEAPTSGSVAGVELERVAIIKLLRHHVTVGEEKEVNALAVYYKRYPFTDPGVAQHIFSIQGYNDNILLLR